MTNETIEQLSERFTTGFFVSPKNHEAMSIGAAITFGLVQRSREAGRIWLDGTLYTEAAAIELGFMDQVAVDSVNALEYFKEVLGAGYLSPEAAGIWQVPEVSPEEKFLTTLREFISGRIEIAAAASLFKLAVQNNTK